MKDQPALATLLDAAHVVSIPTRTRFRGLAAREAVLFDAPTGASEFSPFPEYGDDEAAVWLGAAIEFGWEAAPSGAKGFSTRIPVNATIPAVAPGEVPGVLARFPGCTTAKVKVAEPGQPLAADVARVRAVREALGPSGLIRVDANGGWGVEEAELALAKLAEFGLDYAEQPCASVPELAELRARLDGAVRIAADESVRKAEDPLAVARAGAADLLVIKSQPLGGTRRALRIVSKAGLPVVVSSALDTSVGIAMGAHLAASLPDGLLHGACGLGTAALLNGDVTAEPLLPADGAIDVRRPRLDPALLAQFAAPAERQHWWRERISRCYAELAGPAQPEPVG